VGSWVELIGGAIGAVRNVGDSFVTIDLGGRLVRYAKTSVCRVLPIPLELPRGTRVRTIFGVVGATAADVAADDETVRIAFLGAVNGQDLVLELPRGAIGEVLR
jgi:preprotein translocase subunit YajC